jgi:hypothetical protein
MEGKEGEKEEAGAGSGAGVEMDEDEVSKRMRARAGGRGRRGVVFSEAVAVDAGWTPVVIEKSAGEVAEISGVMAANILLGGMDEDGRAVIVGAMARKAFGAGEVIIRQGDPGDFFYIIASGAWGVGGGDRGLPGCLTHARARTR